MMDSNDKPAPRYGRDLGFFALGLVVGAGGTVIAGHLTNGAVPAPKVPGTPAK